MVIKGPKRAVTAPSLVNEKTVCDLNVKIEELQQEAGRVKSQLSSRDHYIEQRLLSQEREINFLNRKSCPTYRVTTSTPNQARMSDLSPQATPAIPVDATPAVTQPSTLTLEEVEMVEIEVEDATDACTFQLTLDVRGKDVHPEHLVINYMFCQQRLIC